MEKDLRNWNEGESQRYKKNPFIDEEGEFDNKKFYHTISEIESRGTEITKPIPEKKVCEFCHEEIEILGFISPTKIFVCWIQKCNCSEAKRHRRETKEKERQERYEAEEKQRKLERFEALYNNSFVGQRFKSRTFETFIPTKETFRAFQAVKKYVDNFEEYMVSGTGLIISGNCGVGKTHLAAGISQELNSKGFSTIFGTLISLMDRIKKTYNQGQDDSKIFYDYCNVDLLIIDDLGKEKVTEWLLEKFWSIVNHRYENNKPIVITSNYLSENELIQKFSINCDSSIAESIVSRICEVCRGIRMNAPDYRRRC